MHKVMLQLQKDIRKLEERVSHLESLPSDKSGLPIRIQFKKLNNIIYYSEEAEVAAHCHPKRDGQPYGKLEIITKNGKSYFLTRYENETYWEGTIESVTYRFNYFVDVGFLNRIRD